jgi:hypothetical protein
MTDLPTPSWAISLEERDDGTFVALDAKGDTWELTDPSAPGVVFLCPDCKGEITDRPCDGCDGSGDLGWTFVREECDPSDWGWRVEPNDACAWRRIS